MKALQLDAEWRPRAGYYPSERERRERRADNCNQVYFQPRLRLVDLPEPEPGPGEIVARVRACGVCGSDAHLFEQDRDGYIASADPAKLPVVLGHEWSGVVEAVGPGVQSLRPGDAVCGEVALWCGQCAPCRAGAFGQCQNLDEIGFSVDGALAEYVRTRPQYCWRIDALLQAYSDEARAFEAGALVEPTAVAYNALFVRAGGFRPGGAAAVFGAGPIGLVGIALARLAGAAPVLAFETVPERRALAARVGADLVFDPLALAREGRDAAELIQEATDGAGLAIAVEAAGASPRTFPVIERAMAVGGKIVQVGITAGQTPLTLVKLQAQGVNLYGSMGSSGAGLFPAVIQLMASGRLDLTPIITARFPLEQADAALRRMAERRDGKVLVTP